MPPSPPATVEDDEEEYVMEKIVGKRRDSKGNIEYRVKWEGYPSDEDTWEKASKLTNRTNGTFKRGYAILNEYRAELRRERQSRSPAASTATPRSTTKKATPKSTPRGGISKPKGKEGKTEATKKSHESTKQTGSSSMSANFTGGDETEYEEEEEIENVPVAEANAINEPEAVSESLEEPFVGKKYRVQQGIEVLKMLGVKRSLVDGIGSVVMVQYEDKSYELVPSTVLVEKCPRKLVAYYESHLGFS